MTVATVAVQITKAQAWRGYDARVLLEGTRDIGFGIKVAHPIRCGQVIALYPRDRGARLQHEGPAQGLRH
jgi:hypothetical protein